MNFHLEKGKPHPRVRSIGIIFQRDVHDLDVLFHFGEKNGDRQAIFREHCPLMHFLPVFA